MVARVADAGAVTEARLRAGLSRLLWGRGVAALGDGLWFTIWALYFTRSVGLSPAAVGVGMAIGSGCGLLLAVPIGALADRRNPRDVLVALTAVRGLAMAGYLAVHQPWSFTAVTAVFTGLASGSVAVRTALVAGLVGEHQARLRTLAQQRVAQHVGYAIGAAAGAAALAADRTPGYLLAIAGNAATFLVLAAVTATVPAPRRPGSRRERGGTRAALRDLPFVAVTATTAGLALCWAMLSTGLPIWISTSTRLPPAVSGAMVVISSVGIAILQIPVSRLAATAGSSARLATGAGVALAASCALLATTAGGAGPAAVAVVLAAGLLHLAGELGYVGAAWGLSMTLMREDARGAYQGLTEAATATVQMIGPALFSLALSGLGAAGWLLVAAVFLGVAAPITRLARWAARTR